MLVPEFELRAPATTDCCRFYYAMLDTIDTCFRTGAPVKEYTITSPSPIIPSMLIILDQFNFRTDALVKIFLQFFIYNFWECLHKF